MMKKLIALTLALLLLSAPALAESPILTRIRTEKLLGVICEVLDEQQLPYEKDPDYDSCYLYADLMAHSVLGDSAYCSLDAYKDGVCIIGSYSEIVPAAHRDELMRLCHHLNSGIYLGKFYVDPYYDGLCYELFIPMDAMDVREFDRNLIIDYFWTVVSTLDYYQEYFLLVIDSNETADNVFAMWEADTY